jgi:hypothetical protein
MSVSVEHIHADITKMGRRGADIPEIKAEIKGDGNL